MHCIILANTGESFPSALLPMKGRAVIDYLIEDALIQKDITAITVLATEKSHSLLTKHLKNAFPMQSVEVKVGEFITPVLTGGEDTLVLQGNIYSSLKLQDFIRYYKQFKTVTKAAYDKLDPKEIPFFIVPKKYVPYIEHLPDDIETHIYNCGSGYNISCI